MVISRTQCIKALKQDRRQKEIYWRLGPSFWHGLSGRCGLILTEALLAVTLLTIGGIALGVTINNAIQVTAISRNFMIGQNLVTEAIEAVKNVRDTNWLMHPQNPELWLCLVPAQNCQTTVRSTTPTLLAENTDSRWNLKYALSTDDLSLENYSQQQKEYRLWLAKVDTHAGSYWRYVPSTSADITSESPYYRRIKFLSVNAESATFEVKVQWYEGVKVRTISKTYVISN